jgi:sulfatase maturation enzyme AslB (radical SAM superfamily)
MNKELRPIAMVNITNRCTLKCKHCFVYREGTPHTPTKDNEMPIEQMIKEIEKYKRKYRIVRMVWMGGEPLLRKDVLQQGVKIFSQNTVTTNGTLPLINLGSKIIWVISLDGPEDINDELRGKGSFKKVINNLNNIPEDFQGDFQCSCVVTKNNENRLEEFIETLQSETPLRGVNFGFYVPKKNDTSGLCWKNLEERDTVIKNLMKLKKKYPRFILNHLMVLELMLSHNALEITHNCPVKNFMVPMYLGDKGFEQPFCCYGNDVNCDLCGSWAAFHLAALIRVNPGWPDKVNGPFKNITSS